MAIYFIGLGLNNEKDISVAGLEAVKKCDLVYFEDYTSLLSCSITDLEDFYGKKIISAGRNTMENESEKILSKAETKNVAVLIVGDPFSATTHVDLMLEAKEKGIEFHVLNNASVLTAVGITGLQLYKFGKTTSIPYDNKKVTTPYDVFVNNKENSMHTLFLLDIKSEEKRFMSVNEAIDYLLKFDKFTEDTLCVGCARLGSDDFVVKSGKASELKNFDFGKPVQCLIVPGELHFREEEALELWK